MSRKEDELPRLICALEDRIQYQVLRVWLGSLVVDERRTAATRRQTTPRFRPQQHAQTHELWPPFLFHLLHIDEYNGLILNLCTSYFLQFLQSFVGFFDFPLSPSLFSLGEPANHESPRHAHTDIHGSHAHTSTEGLIGNLIPIADERPFRSVEVRLTVLDDGRRRHSRGQRAFYLYL